jgi:hypothetical protein
LIMTVVPGQENKEQVDAADTTGKIPYGRLMDSCWTYYSA